MNPTIAALRAALESERKDLCFEYAKDRIGIKLGHEAATERLMAIVEKAVEVISFYADREKQIYIGDELDLDPEVGTFISKDDFEHATGNVYIGKFHGKNAREFLAELEKEFK